MDGIKKVTLYIVAFLFLLLFAAIWGYIAVDVQFYFNPTTAQPQYELSNDLAIAAGFLASTVAAGTAAFLGIEIRQPSTSLVSAAARSWMLFAGVVCYAVVGFACLVILLLNSETAPDALRTFAFGALGWAAGAFAAFYAGSNNAGGGSKSGTT